MYYLISSNSIIAATNHRIIWLLCHKQLQILLKSPETSVPRTSAIHQGTIGAKGPRTMQQGVSMTSRYAKTDPGESKCSELWNPKSLKNNFYSLVTNFPVRDIPETHSIWTISGTISNPSNQRTHSIIIAFWSLQDRKAPTRPQTSHLNRTGITIQGQKNHKLCLVMLIGDYEWGHFYI
mgnify:FL=1